MPVLGIVLGGLLGLWAGSLFFTEPCDSFGNCAIPDPGPFFFFGLAGAAVGCLLGVLAGKRLWPRSEGNAFGFKATKR
jgi:hypothetical protein